MFTKYYTKPRPTGPKPQTHSKPSNPSDWESTRPTGQNKTEIPRKAKSQSISRPIDLKLKAKPHTINRQKNIGHNTAQNTNHTITPYTSEKQLAQYGPNNQRNPLSPNSGKAQGLIRPATTKTQPHGHKTTTDPVAWRQATDLASSSS